MAEEKGIHYRTGGKITNAGCEMLPDGKDIPYIVIESIEYKDKHKVNGRDEEGIWVATFAPNPYTKLPIILNATNKKRLSKMFGTEYINTLKNVGVRLTKEKTKDVQDGGMTWGLRIHKDKPTPPAKETLTPKHEKWQEIVDGLKSAKYTIDNLRGRVNISAEVEGLLNEAVKTK